jgi:hypothetical protein
MKTWKTWGRKTWGQGKPGEGKPGRENLENLGKTWGGKPGDRRDVPQFSTENLGARKTWGKTWGQTGRTPVFQKLSNRDEAGLPAIG